MSTIQINLRFNVIDKALLSEAVAALDDSEVFAEGESASQGTLAEQIDLVVSHLDVIALAYGHHVGWNDLGLERVQ